MECIHGTHPCPCRFSKPVAEYQLQVVCDRGSPKVRLIEAMFAAALVEEGFGRGLQMDKRTAEENPVRILKYAQGGFLQFGRSVVRCNQNTAIQIRSGYTPRHLSKTPPLSDFAFKLAAVEKFSAGRRVFISQLAELLAQTGYSTLFSRTSVFPD